MNEIDMSDGRWGYVFLMANGQLPEPARIHLVTQAIDMYYKSEETRKLLTDWYEGRLSTKREFQMLGIYGGQRFDAELDTDEGKIKMAFLVQDMTSAARATDISARMN